MSSENLRRRSHIWIGVLGSLAMILAPTASPGNGGQPVVSAPFADGTVLVGFEPGTQADKRQAIAGSVDATDAKTVGAGTHVLHVPKGEVLTKIAALKANPNIRYAEPDYILKADGNSSASPF